MADNLSEFLGQVLTVPINKKNTLVRLVDGEYELNQVGLSAGFVHFVDPDDSSTCLGFCGVDWMLEFINGELNATHP